MILREVWARSAFTSLIVAENSYKIMSETNFPVKILGLLIAALPLAASAQTNVPGAAPQAPAPVPAPAKAPAMPPGVTSINRVVIGKGGDQDLHAEIAYPTNAPKPMPAIIFIHGGGWKGGSPNPSQLVPIVRAGYFGASIEYRLSAAAKWPAQIEDCKLAVRWLRANAEKYGVDPNRIGVWGESAGGHLVACLATMGDEKQFEGDGGYPGVSSKVQAVVDFYGPSDFTNPANYSKQATGYTKDLMGGDYEQNPDLWKSGSPVYFVKAGDPPMLLVHGDADGLVPLAQSQVLDAALTKAGVPHELIVVKNGGHGFRPKPGTTIDPSKEDINKAVFAFFDKYLRASK